jgi:uncharacterized Fe-S cluster protein YjdI
MMDEINKKYSNGEITIDWKPDLCIHVRTCFTELPQVFDPWERPWVNPLGATTDEIIRVVDLCPTKALSWYYNNKKETETQKIETDMAKVTIIENGPYLLKGDFKVYDAKGNEIVTESTTALCRCGYSKKKPFCDGMHKEIGFKE